MAPAAMPQAIKRMYDDTGRVNADAIAEALGETPTAIARALGAQPRSVLKNPTAESIQRSGQRLLGVLEELTHYFDGDFHSVVIWMRKPHADLEGETPLALVLNGNLDAVAHLVSMIGMGEPG